MRGNVTAAGVVLGLLAAVAPTRADDGLVRAFEKLQRGTRWERTAAVPVGFPTHHP